MKVIAKPKVLFFCSRLGGGGAEMHLVRLLNNLKDKDANILLALARKGGNYEYLLESHVKKIYLSNIKRSSLLSLIRSTIPLVRLINKEKPAVVVSFMDRQNVVLDFIKKFVPIETRLINCCQNVASTSLKNDGWQGRFFKRLIPSLYKRADKIIAISEGVKTDLENSFSFQKGIKVIYNAGFEAGKVNPYLEKWQAIRKPHQPFRIVACGRLRKQKGFDILIKALAQIKEMDWQCTILGEGKDREHLEELINNKQLGKKIWLPGFNQQPMQVFADSDLFVLSSRWEGFGNVIVESMIAGTPVLATDCPHGPAEILDNGMYGWLVPNEDIAALATKIREIMMGEGNYEQLRPLLRKRAFDFEAKKIANQYWNEIEALCDHHN